MYSTDICGAVLWQTVVALDTPITHPRRFIRIALFSQNIMYFDPLSLGYTRIIV